ncbi:MAG: RNA polymerase sigma factor [Armatimonadota bacterium]|nr:RNA polymerase sigma factor [Armatimonadota bacterium]
MDDGVAEQNPEEDEDTRLMCEVREGSVEAFSTLYHRRRRRVEHFLYCLFWHREKAEDGAQEVFVRLWTTRDRFRACGHFTPFLYRIARNYWRDEVRKMQVRPSEVDLPVEGDAPAISGALRAAVSTEPQHHLFVRYQQWRIQEAIARLPEHYRIVFVLAHLEDHKIAEIAAILEIPEGTVKSRMHTATRLLRSWLAEDKP